MALMNQLKAMMQKKRTNGLTNKHVEIKTGMFCTVESSDFCEHGIKRGNLVYVYGEFMSRVSEEDPYSFRKIFVATKTQERRVVESEKPFTIDGTKLKPVKKAAQERLEKLLEEDYKQEEA